MVLRTSQISAMPSSLSRNLTCVAAATLEMTPMEEETPTQSRPHLCPKIFDARTEGKQLADGKTRCITISGSRCSSQLSVPSTVRICSSLLSWRAATWATSRVVDWAILKRAARYLLGAPRAANRANNSNHLHRQRLGRRAGQQKINHWRAGLSVRPTSRTRLHQYAHS